MRVSVIISTYNSPAWLEKVLWGFEHQTYDNFEIVIADDGSGEPTRNLIDSFRQQSRFQIVHVWHEDRGFQKSQILNKAISAASTEYLIFTDGDCIPRADFVEVHVRNARAGKFLSGGYFMLPMSTSKTITKDDILSGTAFRVKWLIDSGVPKTHKLMKLLSKGWLEKFLNFVTPTKATWNGHNSSGWRKDIIEVNGFNEEMQYGGQDRELGERMVNKGIEGIQIRYSAICLHLDHKRGYKTIESINKNRKIRSETRSQKKTWTEFGIVPNQNMSGKVKISATIITLNEEKKIEPCIKSLIGVADEIIVVDSRSTDETEAICRKYPVKFISHEFEGYVGQKNFAVRQATYDHILALDADERLSDELKESILHIKNNWNSVDGYAVDRYNNYCGKWMHFSGWYPERKVRLWDRRRALWGGTDPHDFVQLPKKRTKTLKGNLLHYAYLSLDEHMRQIYRFAEIAARAKYKKGEKPNFTINVIFSPLFRFVKSYFFQLGFLDGYYGFIFCTLSASMTFFKYARLYEYHRKGLPEQQKIFVE